jgi:cytochrome c oxidase subunit 4
MAEIQHHEHHHHHLMSLKTHLQVFGALIVLTILTVVVAQFHFGAFGTAVAFLVATAKAVLVMGWFMHLKYDGVMNRVIFAAGFFFLLLFVATCLLDIYTRIDPRV